ncbi:hypothetical protein N7474_003111 [Penicillium riverlandense]|uniref:uncharacterized protein n=1 Tax=Penicillium riverlandense TaxID=1903569 RepID=UPI00254981F7|nr:uncharacterized protein N7474_003111 [Penicillium riverlandense]KAJ5825973.1 hypothetical protein N7474_003111 [Penicillium riverlandense]
MTAIGETQTLDAMATGHEWEVDGEGKRCGLWLRLRRDHEKGVKEENERKQAEPKGNWRCNANRYGKAKREQKQHLVGCSGTKAVSEKRWRSNRVTAWNPGVMPWAPVILRLKLTQLGGADQLVLPYGYDGIH